MFPMLSVMDTVTGPLAIALAQEWNWFITNMSIEHQAEEFVIKRKNIESGVVALVYHLAETSLREVQAND